MGRLVSREGQYLFATDEVPPYDVALSDQNLAVESHREMPWMDRVAILDSRDGQCWIWYRANTEQESFDQMCSVALEVGKFTVQSVATEEVEDRFWKTNGFNDGELEAMLGAEDGQ